MVDLEKLKRQIGEKLKAAREAKEMSQEELAKMLGLSKVGYGALERGKNLIGLQHLLMLTLIFNKPITSFLPDFIVTDAERNNPDLDPRFQYLKTMWALYPEYVRDILHRLAANLEILNPDVRRIMRERGIEPPPLPDEISPAQRKMLDGE